MMPKKKKGGRESKVFSWRQDGWGMGGNLGILVVVYDTGESVGIFYECQKSTNFNSISW